MATTDRPASFPAIGGDGEAGSGGPLDWILMRGRAGRPTQRAAQIYLAILAVGSAMAAAWLYRYFDRVGYGQTLTRAREAGGEALVIASAPFWLVMAALVGGALVFALRRPRWWALIGSFAAALAAMGVLYRAHRLLVGIERVFYEKSSYTAVYRKFAYPVLAATIAFAIVVALDVIVISRRRRGRV